MNNVKVQKIYPKEIFIAPNLISLFRILAAITILIAALIREVHLWVAILYLIAVLSDKIDGAIARFFKKRTQLGQI
ncbi:MAG: CDP-alcohol phosphatidyltransferase family protein [Patescibacteria group bacterium]